MRMWACLSSQAGTPEALCRLKAWHIAAEAILLWDVALAGLIALIVTTNSRLSARMMLTRANRNWRRGDALTYTNKGTHKDNGWEVTSPSSDALYVENHIADLLRLVLPVREKFKSLPAGSSVMLICGISVYPDREMPSLFFDAETLRVLGEIHADLDIDLCCVES